MKHRLKGLLALVLSLVMVLGMVTVSTASQSSGGGSASTTYPVKIGGVELTSDNISSYAGISFTPTDGTNPATLTLNDFTYNGTEIGISADVDLIIKLIGENNTITTTSDKGISVIGNLTIEGSNGKVTATGVKYGIYANSVTLTGCSVTATATGDDGWGIYGDSDVIIKDGAKVKANANNNGGIGIATKYSTPAGSYSSANTIVISGEGTEVEAGCKTGLSAYEVTILENSKLTVDAATTSAIVCGALKFYDFTHTNNNWYQWKADNNPVEKSSDTNQLLKTGAENAKFLTIEGITYTITKAATSNGSFTVSAETAAEGTEITITPSANSGYIVDTITVTKDGGGTVDLNNNKFTMPATNVTVAVTFKTSVGQNPATPQPPAYYPIYIPTVEDEPEVTAPDTFDGGIASAVVVTILSATGGAWLAKKKD